MQVCSMHSLLVNILLIDYFVESRTLCLLFIFLSLFDFLLFKSFILTQSCIEIQHLTKNAAQHKLAYNHSWQLASRRLYLFLNQLSLVYSQILSVRRVTPKWRNLPRHLQVNKWVDAAGDLTCTVQFHWCLLDVGYWPSDLFLLI